MRRFLLLVLMLVLSVQGTWAAASSVCRHEAPGAQAQHFGHHAHVHEDGAAEKAAQPSGERDADCGHCHLGGNALAFLGAGVAHAPLPAAAPTPYRRSVTQGLPERLTRPPHRFLV